MARRAGPIRAASRARRACAGKRNDARVTRTSAGSINGITKHRRAPALSCAARRKHHMQEIRCGGCNRKLGAGEYVRLTIKCPRCRAMNFLRAASPLPAGQRASDTRESPHATHHLC
ncbi:Com family DNA-binding transcriptional regulator [Burkholderia sp. MSHR3999]|uniref:Com family DNA-binding transcriptional regulator n=1 Tax=Burkholderia sp. MSHR3999 TaxID=1542965 RepID=UPI002F3FC9E0